MTWGWVRGHPPLPHHPLESGILTLASIGQGMDGPAAVAVVSSGAVAMVGLADGTLTGGPWPVSGVNALAVAGHVDEGSDLVRIDVLTGRRLGRQMRGHRGRVHEIAVANVGAVPVAASCGEDGTVRLWDLRTGRQIGGTLSSHGGSVLAVATLAAPDGRRLLFSAGNSGAVVTRRTHRPGVRQRWSNASSPSPSTGAGCWLPLASGPWSVRT
jgi:WD40 repeat protein